MRNYNFVKTVKAVYFLETFLILKDNFEMQLKNLSMLLLPLFFLIPSFVEGVEETEGIMILSENLRLYTNKIYHFQIWRPITITLLAI